MKTKKIVVFLLCLMLVFSATPVNSVMAKDNKKMALQCLSSKAVKLQNEMQKAWIDHTTWTRSYIVSAISNLPDKEAVLNRLLQNQQDIGNAIKPYYGEAAGNELAKLLTEHIVIAGQIITAAMENNQEQLTMLNKDWHRNADEISKFLSEANPNWAFKNIQDMLYEHLQLVTEIVVAYLNKDWHTTITVTDTNETHMIHFANTLTDGLVRQFPQQF